MYLIFVYKITYNLNVYNISQHANYLKNEKIILFTVVND